MNRVQKVAWLSAYAQRQMFVAAYAMRHGRFNPGCGKAPMWFDGMKERFDHAFKRFHQANYLAGRMIKEAA